MARQLSTTPNTFENTSTFPVQAFPFAAAGWFNPDNESGAQALISFSQNHTTQNDRQAMIVIAANSSPGSGDYLQCSYRYDSAWPNNEAVAGQITGLAGTWVHVIGVWAGIADRRCSLNGATYGTNTGSDPDFSSFSRWGFGRLTDSTQNWEFPGGLAEWGIWDLSVWPGATDALKATAFQDAVTEGLSSGYAPSFWPLGLKSYHQMLPDDGDLVDIVGGHTMTEVGNPTALAHPPMIYPAGQMIGHNSAGAAPAGGGLSSLTLLGVG